jgi:hypothetical protein
MSIPGLFLLLVLNTGVFFLPEHNNPPYKPGQGTCRHYYDAALKKEVYTGVNKMPSYPGGYSAFLYYFAHHFHQPPPEEAGERMLNMEFIVDTDGKIIGEKIKGKQKSEYSSYDKDALKVLKSSGKWIPGQCNGKVVPVKTYYSMQE